MGKIERMAGRAVPVGGDDIDTDRIMPARYLRAITFEGLETHVFEDDRKTVKHPFDDPRFAGAEVLLVNSNFGCGSSREHAPQGLQRWGITVVIGESFAEIFFGNSGMIGMPCVTASPEDVRTLMHMVDADPQTVVSVDLARGVCEAGGRSFAIGLPTNVRDAFLSGAWDTTGQLLDQYQEVDAASARLPYVSSFADA